MDRAWSQCTVGETGACSSLFSQEVSLVPMGLVPGLQLPPSHLSGKGGQMGHLGKTAGKDVPFSVQPRPRLAP